MKINQIGHNIDTTLAHQLSQVTGLNPYSLQESILKAFGPNPPKFETLIINSILAENALEKLKSMMAAGISKLRQALTPGTPQDLGLLLSFMAPDGGGVDEVNKLINYSKTIQTSVTDDPNWMPAAFDVFNIEDPTEQQAILQQIQQQAQSPAPEEDPAQEQPDNQLGGDPTQPPSPQSPTGPQQTGQMPNADLMAQINQERSAQQDTLGQARELLDQTRQNREAQQKRVDDLRNRLNQLRGVTAEADLMVLGTIIREDAFVQGTPYIMFHIMNRIGHKSPIREGIFGNIGNWIANKTRGVRNWMSNPAYAQQVADQSTVANDNHRMGKLIVNIMTDHLRSRFNKFLAASGITPNELLQAYNVYEKLVNNDNLRNKYVRQFNAARDRLVKAYNLFNRLPESDEGTPFDYAKAEAI